MPTEFHKGDRVLAQFGGDGGEWFPGVVATKRRKDGTYRVNYDDGDVDMRLTARNLKLEIPEPRPTETPESPKPRRRGIKPRKRKATPRNPKPEQQNTKTADDQQAATEDVATTIKTEGTVRPASSISSYERERLERISKNNAMLLQLGLSASTSGIPSSAVLTAGAVARHKKSLGIKRVKRERKPAQPTRRSLRVQGKDADGKELPPNFKEPPARGGYGRLYQDDEPELSISGNVEVDEDGQEFLKSLRLRASKAPVTATDEDADDAAHAAVDANIIDYAERLAKLQVDPDNVRRVTPQRIYSVAFSPSSDFVVAAGDKVGNFGLWACGATFGSDGVFAARPHSHTLSGVLFNPVDTTKIFTCSYDGRVLELDTNKTTFTEIHNNGGDASLFEVTCDPICSAMYLARGDGGLSRMDRRSKKATTNTWDLHEKKINTVSLRPGSDHYLSTASLDRTVAIWDLRSMDKPVHVLPHGLSVNQSSFSPDGKWLCTVAQDNLLRCYDAEALIGAPQRKGRPCAQPKNKCRHDNRTGRWLTKFKVSWDPKQSNVFVIGSMDQPRCIEVLIACHSVLRFCIFR